MPNTTFILVPGSFHTPSAWHAVAELLRRQGYQVLTPALATSSTTQDCAKIADKTSADDMKLINDEMLPELDKGTEVVLVGHSYGSLPATLAVEGQTVKERKARGLVGGVKSLVVVTGFAWPVHGKSIMADDNDPPIPDYFTVKDGVCHLDKEKAMDTFYSDLPQEKRDEVWPSVLPAHSRASFCAFPRFIASDVTIPKTWVLAEKDKTILPAYQEIFAQAGKFDNVVRIDAGHAVPVMVPEKISEILLDVARNDGSSE